MERFRIYERGKKKVYKKTNDKNAARSCFKFGGMNEFDVQMLAALDFSLIKTKTNPTLFYVK